MCFAIVHSLCVAIEYQSGKAVLNFPHISRLVLHECHGFIFLGIEYRKAIVVFAIKVLFVKCRLSAVEKFEVHSLHSFLFLIGTVMWQVFYAISI